MTDEVSICNMALSNIGTRSTISDLDEGSAESVQCSIWYEPTRREMLRAAQWNFARREVALAVLLAAAGTPENADGSDDEPPTPWTYQYAYPSDCLKARYIKPEKPRTKFKLASALNDSNNPIRVILTDMPAAELVYTADITDPNQFDPEFVIALAQRLAARLAIPLTGDKALAQAQYQLSVQTMSQAASSDGNENIDVHDIMPDQLAERGYGESADAIEAGQSFITYVGG